jgi:hypothetical protein
MVASAPSVLVVNTKAGLDLLALRAAQVVARVNTGLHRAQLCKISPASLVPVGRLRSRARTPLSMSAGVVQGHTGQMETDKAARHVLPTHTGIL